MSTSQQRPDSSHRRRVILRVGAIVVGAVIGATLLGLAGALAHNEIPGAMGGAMLGAVIGWGLAKAYIRPFVVWMLVFAVAFAWIGPGCDAPALFSSLCGAVFGAFMNWRRVAAVFGAALGVVIGNSFVGLVIGGLTGWFLAYVLPAHVSRLLSKREIIDRPSYASLRRNN